MMKIDRIVGPYSLVEAYEGSHRRVFSPGDDLSAFSADDRDRIEALWTPEVVAAYQASLDIPSGIDPLEVARQAAFVGDISRQEFIHHLRTDTPEQIEAFVRNKINADGVTDLASARQALKRMETGFVTVMKILALIAR